ncbi:MAG: cupin domain-containing protein [Solirubrobacterales bacterium]|nr:cupin domain-containing protein [Solirubrobacterales bacterium]
MSIETDRPVVDQHPSKVHVDQVAAAPGAAQPEAGKPGWIDMDVRWLVTRQTVGAEDTVFGVTYFPPGSRHEIHRHENAEEVEYLVAGQGVARVGENDVAMGVGDAVFVPRNDYHGFRNTSNSETAVMIWCYAGAASLEEAGYITEEQDRRRG